MVAIELKDVTRRFGDKVAIDSVSLAVPDKEFLVLLGPSGCGKSTLLRMIAGLETLTSGSIMMGDRRVDGLEPGDRDLAFVFQSYALYPHMSVEKNIAFPLIMANFRWWFHIPVVGTIAKRRLAKRADIRDNVREIARVLELTELLRKHPGTLSGGQRQRVAVARAMVRRPAAFLMDEPLSNLDAQLRTHMRSEIVKLHERVDTTFIYVTHDQTEAMTMGTRIVVMRNGVVQQQGVPRVIFERPSNVFVARFIGNPPMNVMPAVVASADQVRLGDTLLTVPRNLVDLIDRHGLVGREVLLGLRPEAIELTTAEGGADTTALTSSVEQLGSETLVQLRFRGVNDQDDGILTAEGAAAVQNIYARVPGYQNFTVGSRVGVRFNFAAACVFDPESEERFRMSEEAEAAAAAGEQPASVG
jgi:multiple sugar transport system ATP-binding protein